MIILIPAYEPGPRLPELVRGLRAADPDVEVLVIDDGSGPRYDEVFAAACFAGADVRRHPVNLGKGAALKRGFALVTAEHPGEDVVTADADGQHTVSDILRVAEGVREDAVDGTPTLVLGCRSFTGDVPLRSRVGNAIAWALFRLASGTTLSDTQTGLRGIPHDLLAWMREQPGERFEYEQNVLLQAPRAGLAMREIGIETVYLEANTSSHFRPFADSLRVMVPILLFAGSSFLAFLVDTVALLFFTALSGMLVPSIIAARIVSASVNFLVNRRLVFGQTGRIGVGQVVRYGLLAVALLASNIVWLDALTGLGVPLLVAKVATEAVLFITSYGVQKTFVFGKRPAPAVVQPRPKVRQGAA